MKCPHYQRQRLRKSSILTIDTNELGDRFMYFLPFDDLMSVDTLFGEAQRISLSTLPVTTPKENTFAVYALLIKAQKIYSALPIDNKLADLDALLIETQKIYSGILPVTTTKENTLAVNELLSGAEEISSIFPKDNKFADVDVLLGQAQTIYSALSKDNTPAEVDALLGQTQTISSGALPVTRTGNNTLAEVDALMSEAQKIVSGALPVTPTKNNTLAEIHDLVTEAQKIASGAVPVTGAVDPTTLQVRDLLAQATQDYTSALQLIRENKTNPVSRVDPNTTQKDLDNINNKNKYWIMKSRNELSLAAINKSINGYDAKQAVRNSASYATFNNGIRVNPETGEMIPYNGVAEVYEKAESMDW